jgi:hypothetical protein
MLATGSMREREDHKMPTLFVAKSDSLQGWASDVGLTHHVYKLGLSDEDDETAITALNEEKCAGRSDWALLGAQPTSETDEADVLRRAARKETMIDPTYYPQLKRAQGIFKVKLVNVENHFMVREALEGQQIKKIKLTPTHIATYLLRMASS